MDTTPWIPHVQIILAAVIITLYGYARHSAHRTQELLYAQMIRAADYAPTLEQIAVACQANREPDRYQSILEQTDFSAVPDLQKATQEALHRLQRRPLHSALVSPPQPQVYRRPWLAPPTALACVILALAGVDLTFIGPAILRYWRPASAFPWLGLLLAVTAGTAVLAAIDLMKKGRVVLQWRAEVPRFSACLVADHLLAPLYRQQRQAEHLGMARLIEPLTEQTTSLSATLAREVKDPVDRLRELVGQLSQHAENVLKAAMLCTESLDALEELPEHICGRLGAQAKELVSTAETKRVQRTQQTQALLYLLARVASDLTENALEELQAQEALVHTPQALEELLATLRCEGAQHFCRVTAESLSTTLAWSRQIGRAATDLLEGLDGVIKANEQSKAYAHEAWTLRRRLEGEITSLLQQERH